MHDKKDQHDIQSQTDPKTQAAIKSDCEWDLRKEQHDLIAEGSDEPRY
jgi:hypothetical protein